MKRSWFTVMAVIVSLITSTIANTSFAENNGSRGGSRGGNGGSNFRLGNSQSSSSGMNRQQMQPTFKPSGSNFSGGLSQGGFQNKMHQPAINSTIKRSNGGVGITLSNINGNGQSHGQIKTLPKLGHSLPFVPNNNVKNGNPIKTMPFPIVGKGQGNGSGNGQGLGIKIGIGQGNGNGNGQGLGLGIKIGNHHDHGNGHNHGNVHNHAKPIWGGCYKPCQPVHCCPPKYCGPVYVWPVCTGPVVIEVPVPVAVEPLMKVPMGATITLQEATLGINAGQVMLQIDKISVPAQVDAWDAGSVTATLPMLTLLAPTRAQLWLIRADGQVANSLTIELIPALEGQASSEAITSVEALSLQALK